MRPPDIHPTAVIGSGVTLGAHVTVGPFAVIESGARLGDRCTVGPFTHVTAGCDIGAECALHTGVALGGPAQVRGNTDSGGTLIVGARTVMREGVTVHRALHAGQATVVGEDCMLLAGSHVAHDCELGAGVTLANGVLLAGHVTVDEGAFLSGNVVVHQHVRIGRGVMVAGQARVSKDVPPYVIVIGDSTVCGVNVVGMRRAGMSAEQRQTAARLHRTMYRSGFNVTQAATRIEQMPPTAERDAWLDVIRTSARGLCAARARKRPQ